MSRADTTRVLGAQDQLLPKLVYPVFFPNQCAYALCISDDPIVKQAFSNTFLQVLETASNNENEGSMKKPRAITNFSLILNA